MARANLGCGCVGVFGFGSWLRVLVLVVVLDARPEEPHIQIPLFEGLGASSQFYIEICELVLSELFGGVWVWARGTSSDVSLDLEKEFQTTDRITTCFWCALETSTTEHQPQIHRKRSTPLLLSRIDLGQRGICGKELISPEQAWNSGERERELTSSTACRS
eukprot:899379-Amphidinium_carterae.1